MAEDRMDFWWNEDTHQYEEGTQYGPIRRVRGGYTSMQDGVTVPSKKDLMDTGTRFQHLADFQDYLADGLQAVNCSLARYSNDTDEVRKRNLESAMKLLSIYQNNLAEMDKNKWDFNRMLDENAPTKEALNAIRIDEASVAETKKADEIRKAQGIGGQRALGPGESDYSGLPS